MINVVNFIYLNLRHDYNKICNLIKKINFTENWTRQ